MSLKPPLKTISLAPRKPADEIPVRFTMLTAQSLPRNKAETNRCGLLLDIPVRVEMAPAVKSLLTLVATV